MWGAFQPKMKPVNWKKVAVWTSAIAGAALELVEVLPPKVGGTVSLVAMAALLALGKRPKQPAPPVEQPPRPE